MWSARVLMKPILAMPLETVDPLAVVPRMDIGSYSRSVEAFSDLWYSVVGQLVVFMKPLPLFAHGDLFPWS
jgi:hypothetical protein